MECYFSNNCSRVDCDKDFCMRKFKLNNLYDNALVSEQQRQYKQIRIDADGTDKEVFTQLHQVELNIEYFVKQGKNIYIHSTNVGNGKTLWSLRLLQDYFNSIWYKSDMECKGLFIHVPRFLLALKNNITEKDDYVQHIKDNVFKADLVIWDEVGTKCLTSFEFENLLNIINTRLDMGKSNIYTSNLTPQELYDTIGDRLHSRIVNMSMDCEFKGKDKRYLTKEVI